MLNQIGKYDNDIYRKNKNIHVDQYMQEKKKR